MRGGTTIRAQASIRGLHSLVQFWDKPQEHFSPSHKIELLELISFEDELKP